MNKEIYTLNQYGHIEINIKEHMDRKGTDTFLHKSGKIGGFLMNEQELHELPD